MGRDKVGYGYLVVFDHYYQAIYFEKRSARGVTVHRAFVSALPVDAPPTRRRFDSAAVLTCQLSALLG